MLTLTVNPRNAGSQAERLKLLHSAWTKLRKRMARRLDVKSIPYMAFVEETKKGEPHLHILLRCGYVHYQWISNIMKKFANAPVVWIEQIKNTRKAVYYVTKYCTKAPAQFGKSKRYWYSQNWEINKPEKQEKNAMRTLDDRYIECSYKDLINNRILARWTWQDIEDGWVRFWRPGYHAGKAGYYVPPVEDNAGGQA